MIFIVSIPAVSQFKCTSLKYVEIIEFYRLFNVYVNVCVCCVYVVFIVGQCVDVVVVFFFFIYSVYFEGMLLRGVCFVWYLLSVYIIASYSSNVWITGLFYISALRHALNKKIGNWQQIVYRSSSFWLPKHKNWLSHCKHSDLWID